MKDISKIDYTALDRPEVLMFLFHPRPEPSVSHFRNNEAENRQAGRTNPRACGRFRWPRAPGSIPRPDAVAWRAHYRHSLDRTADRYR